MSTMKVVRGLLFTMLAAGFVSTTAMAAHRHLCVSTTGKWKPEVTGTVEYFTDLQTALNRVSYRYARYDSTTIWIQDGFVCESGSKQISTKSGTHSGYARVMCQSYAFTVRSESGYVDEANGKGAYIRGLKDPTSTYPDGRGDNAVRPVWCQSEKTIIIGLVLENGATGEDSGFGGGAIYGPCIVSNCVLRNVAAYCGGAIGNSSVTVYNTVISNCYAFGTATDSGGGAVYGGGSFYNCLIASNSTCRLGGAVYYDNNNKVDYHTTYSNCVFRDNYAEKGSGAVCLNKNNETTTKRATFIDCNVLDNIGKEGFGGVSGAATMIRCTIAGNKALTGNGGGVGVDIDDVLENCRPVLEDCVVSNNSAQNEGGGLYGGSATNCVIAGNKVGSIDVSTGGNGGGAAHSDLCNCYVTNNWSAYRGAAVFDPDRTTGKYYCYNCLFAGNVSGARQGTYDRGMIIEGGKETGSATSPMDLYNCTIAGNVTPKGAVINYANLINCIVWGNTAPSDFYADQVWAQYTCQKDLEEETEDHNINQNPNLTADYHLATPQPCVNAAYQYDWMTNRVDIRSRDLDRRLRILGPSPDLGCYERDDPGLFIIVR